MKMYYENLNSYLTQNRPADGETVLEMLYEYYNEHHPYDNEQIKADFNALYEAMHGIPLREMDRVIYVVCTLCRDYEKAGFLEGIKLATCLREELTESHKSAPV